jgi:hypothetical protein
MQFSADAALHEIIILVSTVPESRGEHRIQVSGVGRPSAGKQRKVTKGQRLEMGSFCYYRQWRRRDSVCDAPMGPREPRSTVLSKEQEALDRRLSQAHAAAAR